MYPVWAVVIATYNRSGLLRNLLESIQNSSVKPNQVIIVSAGDPIEKSLIEFKNIKLSEQLLKRSISVFWSDAIIILIN